MSGNEAGLYVPVSRNAIDILVTITHVGHGSRAFRMLFSWLRTEESLMKLIQEEGSMACGLQLCDPDELLRTSANFRIDRSIRSRIGFKCTAFG
jgi:hypothetical protein